MTERRIDNPIINSPLEMPDRHFRFDDDGITDDIVEGRRPSAYFMPIPASKRRGGAQQEIVFDEWTRDRLKETEFVTHLRERVDVKGPVLKAEIDPDAWATLYSTVSRPFPRPSNGKIAIKVVNHYGDEIVQVYEVP